MLSQVVMCFLPPKIQSQICQLTTNGTSPPWIQLDRFPISLNNDLGMSLTSSVRPFRQQKMRLGKLVADCQKVFNEELYPSGKLVSVLPTTGKE